MLEQNHPYLIPDSQLSPKSSHSTTGMVAREESMSNTESGMKKAGDYSFFHSKRFRICFMAMCLNVIIFALDQFIVTAAVPQIVSQFQSLDKMEWLNTAFFIPCAGAILVYTQLMTVVGPRWTYLASIVIFEAGSAVCGAAGSMDVLIIGRAIAGLGGAGMWNATYLIGGEVIPFEKRPGYFGLFGVSYILASVMGPLVGGAFTDMSSEGWRWCFYINLPIGGVTLLLLAFALPSIPKLPPFDGLPDYRPVWHKIFRIDWISALLTIGFVTCLGMGLQWGGVTKDWNDVGVIVTLALALVLFVGLILWSVFMGARAMVPMTLFKERHFCAGVWVAFFGYGIVVVYLYYLPLYFEAVKNKSATRAGVLLLALQLTMGPLLVVSGKVGEITGQAKYTIVAGSCLLAVGSGLFTMVTKNSSIALVVGFEAVVGVGLGMVLNVMMVLVQAKFVHQPHLVPHVTNVFNFWGFVGRIVSMSTATNIFNNKLRISLSSITGLAPALEAGIAAAPEVIWTAVSGRIRDAVLEGYSSSLVKTFWLALALSFACLFSALLMEDVDLKAVGEEAKQARESAASQHAYPMQATMIAPSEVKDANAIYGLATNPAPTYQAWKR